jgi:phosphate-selective porin OprO and OprP
MRRRGFTYAVLVAALAGAGLFEAHADDNGAGGQTSASSAAATAAAAQAPETTVDASRGGITIASGPSSLSVGARVQFRWTVDDRDQFDADRVGAGVGIADGLMSQFDVPRMRVTLGGGVFRPWMRYAFQFDFSRTGGEGDSKIKDAIVEIRPPGRSHRFMFGQFKAPFGMQQLTSSGRQQFVDRAITDGKFSPGRDMGAMVAGSFAGGKVGYNAGVFNGAGESVRQSDNSHLWAGRVFVNPLGGYLLSEGASDSGSAPVVHVGFGARGGKPIRGRTPAAGIVQAPDNQTAWNVELAFRAPRVSSTAEYFWMRDEQRNPVNGRDIDARGYHAQVGVMLIPRTVEVGVRYAQVDGDTQVNDARLSEIRGSFGYYWQSHGLKLQADVGHVRHDANYAALSSRARWGLPSLGPRLVSGQRLSDTQVRMQVQVAF